MEYLHSQRNFSVEFSCEAPDESTPPFAFTLYREWIQNEKVLYFNFKMKPTVLDSSFKDRVSVQIHPKDNLRRVNVSITLLQGVDTDMYRCMFHYSTPTGFKNLSARTMFFLYVKDIRKYNDYITPHEVR